MVAEPTLVESITLDITTATLKVNESVTLTATVLPETATVKEVVWSSSDESVATIENGIVTAIAVGNATITATTTDGSNLSATCQVTVNPILAERIELSTYKVEATVGETFVLSATIYPEEATEKAVVWSVSGDYVVEIESIDTLSVAVTILRKGVACITAETIDGSNLTATCEIDIYSTLNDVLNDIDNGIEYYTLDGLKITAKNLVKGIYIKKEGNKSTKVIIK